MRRGARGPVAGRRSATRRKLIGPNAEGTVRVTATVLAVIAEYHQAVVRTDDGRQLAITGCSGGLRWDTLREGQRVVCVLDERLVRVRSVEPG